jgi:D-alanine-D-alanine ligase-like ATP-grasp enzyme
MQTTVAVIFGGKSVEHEVSIISALQAIESMDKERYNVIPVYLTKDDLRSEDNHIHMIGDVTCDIMGSIHSTLRSSTHSDPYYDYNPATEQEEPPFSHERNITVMAVDTCPNALPKDASNFFGEMLTPNVFRPLLEGKATPQRY